MPVKDSFAAMGDLVQMSFITRDFDPLVRFWTETMGAGPFFMIEGLRFNPSIYRGASYDVTVDLMLGNWGDMQVEFIRPRDDTPSVYKEWLDADRKDVHHYLIFVDDLPTARHQIEALGLEITQEAIAYNGDSFYYVDVGGFYMEVIAPDTGMRGLFAMIREAHEGWDGSDPVRPAPSDEINRGGSIVAGDLSRSE